MLAALFDLGGQVRSIAPVHAPPLLAHPRPLPAFGEQLVMRVLPLVVLFDLHEDAESWYYLFGFSSAALGIAVAYAVTYRAAYDPNTDHHWDSLAISAFLFWPHNFFFATTCAPPASCTGPATESPGSSATARLRACRRAASSVTATTTSAATGRAAPT